MGNSNNNRRSTILTKGIKDVLSGNSFSGDRDADSKVMTAAEVASVFAQDELEMLRSNYKCLDMTPKMLAQKISEEVIGQDEAVSKTAFVILYNQKLNLLEEIECKNYKRRKLLLVGPTGSGKTSIYEAVKNNLDIPVIKYSADSITSAGYLGNKVESIFVRLFFEAGQDLPKAERGVIFIDEIDKKREESARDGGKDINGKSVQEELLKVLEADVIDVPLPNKKVIQFDTRRLTIIMMGAFVGLDDIKKKRLAKRNLGFKSLSETMTDEEIENMPYKPQDFIDYGFISEFIGRTPMIARLRKLKKDDILKIIFHGKNSSYKEQTRFLADELNIEQQISKKYLEKLAEELEESVTGVRDLDLKIYDLFDPIIEEALERPNEYGICFIDEDGHFSLEYDDATYYG